jgi:hypothetical protein
LVPPSDRGDDFVWVCGPGEGFWIIIGLGDEAVNGCLEIDNGSEYPAFESALGEFGKETLDGVEPRAGGWREVEDESRVAGEPLTHLRMLVGGVLRTIGYNAWIENTNGNEIDEKVLTMAIRSRHEDAPSS